MPSNKKLLQAASGAGGDPLYVEDVFSTYVYNGNSSNRDIVNGVDLTEGGLVWTKARSNAIQHELFDTERGIDRRLVTNSTAAQYYELNSLSGFNSNGFSLSTAGNTNGSAVTYASWSFRKAENFFTMVEFTADSNFDVIAHDLGSLPGFVIYKCISSASDVMSGQWNCWHSSMGNNDGIALNTNAAQVSSLGAIGDVTSTQCQFYCTVGETYIAYYFGNDQAEFGADSDESIIKCGSYVGNGTVGHEINVGFEPQWVLQKMTTTTGNWGIQDQMRGLTGQGSGVLRPNSGDAELIDNGYYVGNMQATATGFSLDTDDQGGGNGNGDTYIYMAIRRPMKTPEVGTEVFAMDTADGTPLPQYESGFVTDLALHRDIGAAYTGASARLQGTEYLRTNDASATGFDTDVTWDFMNGWSKATWTLATTYSWMFKRATGFMDVVCYVGNATAGATQAHNLGVAPEMMIVKRRNASDLWAVYSATLGNTKYLQLNNDVPEGAWSGNWNNTTPTASVFSLGSGSYTNASGSTYLAYLFASVAGVSKVGSYTGTGSSLNVDCGFTGGARFILIRRYNYPSGGSDWYYWDSVRGISAGNDPYLLLNSTAAQVTGTDYVDPLNAGFTVTSNASSTVNVNGGTYIFLAIA